MKKYRIFLASSAELDRDKELFEIFVSKKNKEWHNKGVFLELLTWKDFVDAISETRLQDDYNDAIRSSDIFIVLFHTNLGRYTNEEFEIAYNQFKKSGRKRPLIFTYFKDESDQSIDKGIDDFKNKLDKLGHFYTLYKNNEDLNHKFDVQLDKLVDEGAIKFNTLNWVKIYKYVALFLVLPVILLISVYYYIVNSQPFNMTVRVKENNPIPGLPYSEGILKLTYGDKTETMEIKEEGIFKQLHAKYYDEKVKLGFSSKGYVPVDTFVTAEKYLELAIYRDNSLGKIFGIVQDEYGKAISSATISIDELKTDSDSNGRYILEIPRERQAEEQRIRVYKNGFENWDKTLPIIQNVEIPIVLKKE